MNDKRTPDFKGKQKKSILFQNTHNACIVNFIFNLITRRGESNLDSSSCSTLGILEDTPLALEIEVQIWWLMKSRFNRPKFHYHTHLLGNAHLIQQKSTHKANVEKI